MIIQNIHLCNFRQFYGLQSISFGKDEKNVTVIFGENGRGKTGIYRAILFCLFGERKLSQDGDLNQNEIHLVNNFALNEKAGEGVQAYVELDFLHHDTKYSIKRSLLGLKDDDDICEEVVCVELKYLDEDGNTKSISEPSEIAQKINKILDSRVKEYFLFDGEKIERLTRADNRQKKEISKGIRNLLDIDSLERSIKAFQKAKSTSREYLQSKSTGEMREVLTNIEDSEKQLEEHKREEEEKLGEIDKANDELKDIDQKLLEFNEIKSLIEERNNIIDESSIIDSKLKDITSEMLSKISKSASMLLFDDITSVYQSLDARVENGEIPSFIKKQLIEIIIEKEKCICSRPITKGTDEYTEILEWLKKTEECDSDELALKTWKDLNAILVGLPSTRLDVHRMLSEFAKNKNDLVINNERLEEISEEIKGARTDGDILEKQRDTIKDDIVKYNKRLGILESDINMLEMSIEKLYSRKEVLEREEGVKSELHKQLNLIEKTLDASNEIYKNFSDDIKIMIAKQASIYFDNLIDSEGAKNLKEIVVNEDYSLQIYDKYGKPFLADISAGQRQVMSIAFIVALAKVASGEKLFEMPLFMDTPFGRLSFEHRRKLIEVLPLNCSQWVLLATDTEFRRQEAMALSKTGRFEVFYKLAADEFGNTKVTKIESDDVMGYLN